MDNLKRKIDTDPDYLNIPEIPIKRPRSDANEGKRTNNTFGGYIKNICF